MAEIEIETAISPYIFIGFMNWAEVNKIKKVLIVDDDVHLATVLQGMIEAEGFEVKIAWDGRLGYLTYLHFLPDLVITDIHMPDRDGFEMMRDIRAHSPEVKTIYMTGDLDRFKCLLEKERERYRINVLEKPFSKAQLLGLISESPR